jgi:hypothetical protein
MRLSFDRSSGRLQLNPTWVAVGLAACVALVLVRAVLPGGALAQQVGWPTPPPGPEFSLPSDAVQKATVRRSVAVEGSVVLTVAPSWPGPVPLIPPIQSSSLVFNDPNWDSLSLTVGVDAGTFDQLVQIRVAPVASSALPAVPGRPQLAWHIEVFDLDSKPWAKPVQRPLQISVPVAALVASGMEGKRLLFWLQDDGIPVPQVTSFDSVDLTLTTRLVSPGMLVMTHEP